MVMLDGETDDKLRNQITQLFRKQRDGYDLGNQTSPVKESHRTRII